MNCAVCGYPRGGDRCCETTARLIDENAKLRAEVERLLQESKEDFNKSEDQLKALNLQVGGLLKLDIENRKEIESLEKSEAALTLQIGAIKDILAAGVSKMLASGVIVQRIEAVFTEKRYHKGDSHVCIAADTVPCSLCGRRLV